MRIGRAARNWSMLCPSDEEYEEFFHILRNKAEEYEELKYRLEFPAASLLITPNGQVFFPSFWGQQLLPLRVSSIPFYMP